MKIQKGSWIGLERNTNEGVVKKNTRILWPYLVLIMFGIMFFGFFLRGGRVLLPADLLVGAYYPWRENKWGYDVAVPYKNPLLSDAYSQFFVWKKLIADAYKQGEWPLWNLYSYSGYPLAGNLHSAAFYPFNILFVWLPFNQGWNWYLILGSVLSSITMYGLIRVLGMSKGAGIVGGIAYGYCGFAMSWMEFATATNSMIWIPLLIVIIEKFFSTKKLMVWWWLPIVIFMLIGSGNFQMSVCGLVIFGTYLVFKIVNSKRFFDLKLWSNVLLWGIVGLLMSGIILWPGMEMLSLSIRNIENNMKNINYGLVPFSHLVSTAAPDFFGNPATGNYWGFLNYHETLIYGGVAIFLAILWSVFNFKILPKFGKYFLLLVLVSLFFYIDSPLTRLGYRLNIPGLSTTTASRNAYFWSLGGSVLLGLVVDGFHKNKFWKKAKLFVYWWMFLGVTGVVILGVRRYYLAQGNPFLAKDIAKMVVSLRNLVIPIGLSMLLGGMAIFFSKWKGWWFLLALLVGFDSWRFTKKYLPVSESKYVFPSTEITDYLKKDKEIFRVEKEKGALLSPNTWTMYGLQSPSGYDPMGLASYTEKFNREINGYEKVFSRYAEIEKYDAKVLGNFNVKYLLAIKKDEEDKIPGNKINYKINYEDWERVMETEVVAVLKNRFFKDRVRVVDDQNIDMGKAKILEYKDNGLIIEYEANENSTLVLLDTWYPGWKAWINEKEVRIDKYDEVFRKIDIDKGTGVVKMRYEPESFNQGKMLSLVGFGMWLSAWVLFCLSKTKRKFFIGSNQEK